MGCGEGELYQWQVLTTAVQPCRSNKQSRSIVEYVGGGGKSAPSMGGAKKQEIQLGGSLFLRKASGLVARAWS